MFCSLVQPTVRERFPHPCKECFVPLSNLCRISQSTPFGAQHPRWHSFPFPINAGSHNPPPPPLQDPASSLALVPLFNRCRISQFTPLQGPASKLAHHPVSGSYTICNGSSSPLADIVFFGFSLSGFPSWFLKRVC